MPDKKLFYLHIEVGNEQGTHYARCVLGNNALEFKQFSGDYLDVLTMLLTDMAANGVYTSLARDPLFSLWPLSGHMHAFPGSVSPPGVGGHSHSHSTNTSPTPIFELHIEFGTGVNMDYYAKTVFTNPYTERMQHSKFMDDAACNLMLKLDQTGVFIQLMNKTSISSFPFPSGSSSPSSSSTKTSTGHPTSSSSVTAPSKDIVRELPSACIGYADITCRDHCTSWDCFGRVKCKNMCSWRKEI